MPPARRIIKTELILPRDPLARAATLFGLAVGGTVALAMVALFTAFLVETFRSRF